MTDESRSVSANDRDELASARIDGELADADADLDRASSDEIDRRAREFEAVSRLVGEPPEGLTASQVDELVATALAAPHELPRAARFRRNREPVPGRRRIWLPPGSVAAAIILVVGVIGITLIVAGNRHPAHQSSAANDLGLTPTTAVGVHSVKVPELGEFTSQAALEAEIRSRAPATTKGQQLAKPQSGGAEPQAAPMAGANTNGPGNGAAKSPTSSSQPASPAAAPSAARFSTTSAAINRCALVIQSTDSTLGSQTSVAAAEIGDEQYFLFTNKLTPSKPGGATSQVTVANAQTCLVLFAIQLL